MKILGGGSLTLGMAGCTGSGSSGESGNGDDSSGEDESTAAESGDENSESDNPVQIGAAFPSSGDLAVFGTRDKRGMNLALEQINSAGLFDSRELNVIVEDTQSSPQAGVSAVQKLVTQDDVPAILGAVSSGVTLAIAQSVTIANEVVQIATASTSEEISALEDNNHVLRTAVSSSLQAKALASVTLDADVDSISFVHVNNSYGIGFAESMKSAFVDNGGEVLNTVSYESGKSSYRPVLNKATEGDPDGLVFVAYPESFATMIKQAYELGLKDQVQYIASDGIVGDAVEQNVPARAINGMIGLNPTPPVNSDVYQGFVDEFNSTYEKTPSIWAAYAYDATMLAAIAIQAAGDAESAAIRDSIYEISRPPGTEVSNFADAKSELNSGNEINYQGVSGTVDLSDAGDVPGTYQLFDVVDGEFVFGEYVETPA